jgi:hypothetical protein
MGVRMSVYLFRLSVLERSGGPWAGPALRAYPIPKHNRRQCGGGEEEGGEEGELHLSSKLSDFFVSANMGLGASRIISFCY